MLQFFHALIAFFSWGSEGVLDKKSMEKLNPYNALSIRHFFVFLWVILAALIFTEIKFPSIELIPYLLFTCLIGSTAIIFFFKSINAGTLSLSNAIAKNYFIITIAFSILFFNETLSFNQIIASLLIFSSLFLLSFDRKEKNLKLGKGVFFALLTLVGWGSYFALIKPIVLELNPFNAALFLESIIFLMILIYSILTGKELKLNEKKSNYFTFFASILLVTGSIAYNFSVSLIGASLTAVIVAPTPILVSSLARIFLKEKISRTKYFAIIVSVIGLILLLI